MDELRLTGNCMKGSRPILSFDDAFTSGPPQLRVLKCLFTDVFGTPRGHPKSKPFVDRVMAFYYADQKVRFLFVVLKNERQREEKKVIDYKYGERMSDLGVTARE